MIRAPFMQNPVAWLCSSRRTHDPVKYATAIEVGRRPLWWWIWRMFK